MRIAIFSDQFYPELSGIADSIIALGKELAKRGNEIHFYVPRYSLRDYEKIGVHEKDAAFGDKIGVTRFWSFSVSSSPSGQGRGVIPAPWDWRRASAFKPDIIHTQLCAGVGLDALMAARKLRVPLVGTNHAAVKAYTKFYPIQKEWFANLLLKYSNWYYEKCDFVSMPSRSVCEEMRMYGFTKECHVISNPIDTDTFRPLSEKDWLRKQFGFSENTVIFASHLSVEKNIDVLIQAIAIVKKEIPSVQFAIAGRGPSENDLRKLVASLELEDSVTFLGFLKNKSSLAKAYNASKVFAIASTAETQSMATIQAMASGLPIVAAKSRALPEYVTRKNGFLVGAGDVQKFAEKIIYLLRNPRVRQTLGENGRELAKNFSAPEIAKRWEEIYQHTKK